MNKERRKALDEIVSRIETLKASASEILADLETIRDEEQDYYDNLPENWQSGEKGENAQTEIDAMEEAIDALGEIDSIEFSGAVN